MANPLSAEKYIQTRARTLKIDRCLVNAGWETGRTAQVVVIRKHPNGNFTYAGYLVDLLCLGVKDTFYAFNESQEEIDDWLNDGRREIEIVEIEYSLAHNIIYAAHDLAADYHIPQHPDFDRTTRFLLEEDDDNVPLIEIHTGDENGLPHLVVGSANEHPVALARLKQYAGEGAYRYTIVEDDFEMDEDDDDNMDEEDDDEWSEEEWEEDETDCEYWSREEWESFIYNLGPDNYKNYGSELSYMYLCAVTIPGLEKRGLDYRNMVEEAGKRIDWEEGEADTWLHSSEEKEELGILYDQILGVNRSGKSLKKTIDTLKKGINRWPGNPVYRNYLYNTYLLLGDKKAAEAEMHELVKLFPDYLVGKAMYAEWLLKKDRPEEVPDLFHSKRYLSELYPARECFHINEFMHFNTAWLNYFLVVEDFCMADLYGRLLERLPDYVLRESQEKLLQLMMLRRIMDMLPIIGNARSNPAEMFKLSALVAGISEKYW